MRCSKHVALASALALTAGCLPDYAPDGKPRKLDAGVDSGMRDADVSTTKNDAVASDAGGVPDSAAPTNTGVTSVNAPPGCDFSGKWFVNEHWATETLTAIQIANNWYYYEVSQNGNDLLVTRSINCGARVNGARNSLAATADDSAAWPEYTRQPNYGGRTGSVTPVGENCAIKFDQHTVVKGATVSFYTNLDAPLPKVNEPATAGGHGWEDWDMDNNPGFTLRLSGLVGGATYIVARSWTIYEGTVAKNATTLKLPTPWFQERSTLGSEDPNATNILSLQANRYNDESFQFTQLAKLTEAQASGAPEDLCERLRELAPTITPDSNVY